MTNYESSDVEKQVVKLLGMRTDEPAEGYYSDEELEAMNLAETSSQTRVNATVNATANNGNSSLKFKFTGGDSKYNNNILEYS
jgi:hypothetical protein